MASSEDDTEFITPPSSPLLIPPRSPHAATTTVVLSSAFSRSPQAVSPVMAPGLCSPHVVVSQPPSPARSRSSSPSFLPPTPPRTADHICSVTVVPGGGGVRGGAGEEEKDDDDMCFDDCPPVIPLGRHQRTLTLLSEDTPAALPPMAAGVEAPHELSGVSSSSCGPDNDEPVIAIHHLVAFGMVVFTEAMISGAMSVVGMEYRQKLGVTVFFQTLTMLVVGPAMGYAALTFGYLSDRVDSKRWGRRKPLLLPLMLLASAGLFMYFTPPDIIKKGGALSIPAWFLVSSLLYKIPAEAYNIIMNAWYYEMSRSSRQRARLFAAVNICNLAGGGIGLAIATARPHAVRTMCFILVVISIANNLYLLFCVPHQPQAEKPAREPLIPAMRSFLNNRPFRVLFISFFVVGFCNSLSTGLHTYFCQQVFKASYMDVQKAALMGGTLMGPSIIAANMAAPRLICRFGAKRVMLMSMMVMGLELIAFFFLTYMLNLMAFTAVCAIAMGFASGVYSLTGKIMTGGAIDYDALMTGKRRESLYSGVYTLPNIFNASLAASVGLGILGGLGFKSDMNPHTGLLVDNNMASIVYLRVMVTFVPAFGLFAAAFFMRSYNITPRKHKFMVEQIHRREAGEVFEIVDPLAPGFDERKAKEVAVDSSTGGPVTPSTLTPHSIATTQVDIFGEEDADEERERLFLYFSTDELWMMTKAKGIKVVFRTFVVETLLSLVYMVLLTYASIKSLLYAVKDVRSRSGRAEVKKAQYEAQIDVALVMVCSLVVLFNLGRAKGMFTIRQDNPDDVSFQAYYHLRKVKGERIGKSSRKSVRHRIGKTVIRTAMVHSATLAVVVLAVVLAVNLGPNDHMLAT